MTYHLALFEDYNMERLVLQQSGIEETSWIYEVLLHRERIIFGHSKGQQRK